MNRHDMSDTRHLTNPRLHICGRIEDSSNVGGVGGGSSSSSTPLCGWLRQVLSRLRCRRRRKEWRTNDGSTTPVSEAIFVKKDIVENDIDSDDDDDNDDAILAKEKYEHLIVGNLHLQKLKNSSSDLNFHWLTSHALSDTFKVLLVFPRDGDQQSEIIAGVARKLGWRVTEARNAEEATEMVRAQCPDLAIVDRRGSLRSQDADEICRTLSSTSNKKCCSIIALVKRSFFTAPHNEEAVILDLLNIGYSRALMECSHEEILMNELLGIHAGESQPKSQLAAAQLLYLAVDRCRDIIQVTNDLHVIQFANKASEKLLGYKNEELIGRRMEDFTTNTIFALMDQQLQKGREFEGNLSWRRKKKGVFNVNCRIVPISLPACKETYYLYLYDSTSSDETESLQSSTNYYSARGSVSSLSRLQSERRASNKPRRSTIAKLHNLPLEAPITKIITLLAHAIHDSDSPEVASQIGQAIDLLKSTKLYSPQLKDNLLSISNPVAAELLEALINVPTTDRKSSSISLEKSSAILKILNLEQNKTDTKITKIVEGLPELEELLETCFDWNFDIFKLETLSNRRPLFFLGMTLMSHYRVAERLDCDERTLQNWLTIIEANYNTHVSYHNSTHATDVLQGVARFLRSQRLQEILDPLDEVAALIAAASHDIGHPGKSSQFLCNSSNKLAILYNDLTVLESHHAALTFKLTLSDDNVNIFKNLDRELYRSIRQNIIDMILATEMTKHFEHLTKFVNVCSRRASDADSEIFDADIVDTTVFLLPENVTMTKRMMIKCADVSNPTRPFKLYLEWTRRIAEEYFFQTDEEKRKNMPVVMPMFDRSSCSIPKSQIGFVDFIINDMMEAWDAFIDLPEMIGNMRENYDRWKEFNEQGIMTIEDIKKLQETPELKLYTKSS